MDESLSPAHSFPLEATIPEFHEAIEGGRITSVEIVDFSLARIAAYDDGGPVLNALIAVNPAAREEAAALDAEWATSGPRGSLHGIPVVIKDNINTAEMPTTAGSLALQGFGPGEDAFQVQKLREAGAVIIAKSNLYEFAWGWETLSSLGGQTLSPYDLSRDPGGSSGGSAVAVAANFAAAGLGTDTCGSVRLPAAENNLYGLRPTSGLTSRAGVIPLSLTVDTVGPMARSVIDLAIMLETTAGVDPADPTTVPVEASFVEAVDPDGLEGQRIGVLELNAHPEVESTIRAALDEMAANGAEVIPATIPDLASLRDILLILDAEFRFALDEYLAAYPHAPVGSLTEILDRGLHLPQVAGALRRGLAITLDSSAYRDTLARREPLRDAIVAFMDDNDLTALAYPTSGQPAVPVGSRHGRVNCSTASMGGLPALVVPAGFTSGGLPVGLELIGRPFDEPTLLAMAAGYEAHTHHRMLPPTTPPLDPPRPGSARGAIE